MARFLQIWSEETGKPGPQGHQRNQSDDKDGKLVGRAVCSGQRSRQWAECSGQWVDVVEVLGSLRSLLSCATLSVTALGLPNCCSMVQVLQNCQAAERATKEFELVVPMTLASYLGYAMTETNVNCHNPRASQKRSACGSVPLDDPDGQIPVDPTSNSDILIDLRSTMQRVASGTEPQTERFVRSARIATGSASHAPIVQVPVIRARKLVTAPVYADRSS